MPSMNRSETSREVTGTLFSRSARLSASVRCSIGTSRGSRDPPPCGNTSFDTWCPPYQSPTGKKNPRATRLAQLGRSAEDRTARHAGKGDEADWRIGVIHRTATTADPEEPEGQPSRLSASLTSPALPGERLAAGSEHCLDQTPPAAIGSALLRDIARAPANMNRLCVFCGSSPGRDPAYLAVATELGTLLPNVGSAWSMAEHRSDSWGLWRTPRRLPGVRLSGSS